MGSDANLAEAAPEANAYEFRSQGIVDMLDKLQAKFIDERTEMESMETNAKQPLDMLAQDLKALAGENQAAAGITNGPHDTNIVSALSLLKPQGADIKSELLLRLVSQVQADLQ